MIPIPDSFDYGHCGVDLVYGRDSIADLGESLEERGLERALVVCGSNVGANEELMGPVRDGLGERLAGVFDGTKPSKDARDAFDGLERARKVDADVFVAVGGGSSIDVARAMGVLESDGRSMDDLLAEAKGDDDITPIRGGEDVTPLVAVPTTFAGADVSSGGSLLVAGVDEPPTGEVNRLGIDDPRSPPVEIRYDPALFETTPMGALAGSAMNGFDKGIETIYGEGPTAITDGTAVHGLSLLAEALPRLDDGDPDAMDRAVAGIILVQFERSTNIVHAFGHGFSRRYPVQQGVVHAILVPHVLRYVFEHVDGRRDLLARGLGVDPEGLSAEETAEAVVDAVIEVRDGLGLPTRLRDLDPVHRSDAPAIAEFIMGDAALARSPPGLDPTAEEIEAVIHDAW
ncbi:iron-containing alcohol dehydrogenase family protein [Salinirubellus sp. GCM10025818]|uniref:iron-containing alcohol dehydrogenase family protein n=1 Tax=Salinirubellus TaxID=2162630 RepID=UPI0030CD1025